MNSDRSIAQFKQEIFSEDGGIRLNAAEKLGEIGSDDILAFLIDILKDKNSQFRNAAALALGEIGDSRAIPHLVEAINNPENKNNCGSLVYALANHDCRNIFLFLIEIALHGNYEVQSHSLNILEEQAFSISENDVAIAKKMIKASLNFPDKCDDFESLIVDLTRLIKDVKKV